MEEFSFYVVLTIIIMTRFGKIVCEGLSQNHKKKKKK